MKLIFLILICFHFTIFAGKVKKGSGTTSKKEEGGYVIERRSDGTVVKYKKKDVYDFEGLNLEGLYNKPTGAYISNIKDVKARSVIRIRKNFDEEVTDSLRHLE